MNDNKIKSLSDMYEEAFNCSSKAMKEYLEKRILIIGHSLEEQDKIEHLFEIRDYPIDGFAVMEWDAFIECAEYFEGKRNEK